MFDITNLQNLYSFSLFYISNNLLISFINSHKKIFELYSNHFKHELTNSIHNEAIIPFINLNPVK